MAYSTMGTSDLFTAIAHIIIGDRHAMDAAHLRFADGATSYVALHIFINRDIYIYIYMVWKQLRMYY